MADNISPHLKRVLSLSDLVIYGIILIQPVAPWALFGTANRDSAVAATYAAIEWPKSLVAASFSAHCARESL